MRIARTLLIALACALFVAPAAAGQEPGTEPTREEFVAAADAICREHYVRTWTRLHRAAHRYYEEGRLRKAGRALKRAAGAAMRANDEIRELPRPPSDAAKLERWLDRSRRAFKLVRRSGHALQRGREERSRQLYRRAKRKIRRANAAVSEFGFKVCA